MNTDLFECTKLSAYFLWEATNCENALTLWYCAEDIACYFERNDITDSASINIFKNRSKYDIAYINFVRNIAYRLFVYTNNTDAMSNWFAAERLLDNLEWCQATISISARYLSEKSSQDFVNGIRSTNVKSYYSK